MAIQTRRAFRRNHYEAPIKYLNGDPNYYYKCRMFNFSEGGLYFEPMHSFSPESQVTIVMANHSPGTYGPEAYRSYLARIRWCRELSHDDTSRFAVGVEFQEKSHGLSGVDADDHDYPCDLCGGLTSAASICRLDGSACLCPQCFKHWNGIPEGIIKNSIHRFLDGNVL